MCEETQNQEDQEAIKITVNPHQKQEPALGSPDKKIPF